MFFRKLDEIMKWHSLTANDIWNVDAIGITTIQTPVSVIGKRGSKQVGAMTTGERDQLVTHLQSMPLVTQFLQCLFPRLRYTDHFIRDGQIRCIGSGNESGRMQEEDFVIFLKHFANHTKVSPEKKLLLLLDNHCSHLSVTAIDFCKNNGIVMLTVC